MNVFDEGGIIGITVSEFKDIDSSLSEKKYFEELIAIYKNNAKFTMVLNEKVAFKQHSFSGYKITAKLYTSTKESSMMYVHLMSNKKIMITSIGICDTNEALLTFEKIVGSIKSN